MTHCLIMIAMFFFFWGHNYKYDFLAGHKSLPGTLMEEQKYSAVFFKK